jgi:hypothetical protein
MPPKTASRGKTTTINPAAPRKNGAKQLSAELEQRIKGFFRSL